MACARMSDMKLMASLGFVLHSYKAMKSLAVTGLSGNGVGNNSHFLILERKLAHVVTAMTCGAMRS